MKQLSLLDYYEKHPQDAAPPVPTPTPGRSSRKKKPVSSGRPKSTKKKTIKAKPAELLIAVGKKTLQGGAVIKDAFSASGDLGLAKMQLIISSGAVNRLPAFNDTVMRAVHYVRGNYADSFNDLNDSVINYAFTPQADKHIKAVSKEYKRRNIRIKVDVKPAEVHYV